MPDPLLTGRGMTMSDQLARHARTAPDDVALRFGAAHRTYRELDDRTTRLANALRRRGIGPGDRIAVLGHNGVEVVESYCAATRLGAICVPVNFRLVADEIAYVLADSGAAAVVVDGTFTDVVAKARAKARCTEVCLVIGDAVGAGPDAERYEDALREASTEPPEIVVDEHAPAFIMYTSGTTGHPKGAVLSHRNLLMHTFSMLVQNGIPDHDRVGLSGAPLFHIAGLAAMLPTLLIGGTWVLARTGGFDPVEAVAVLERERVTSCFFVPAQWQAICAVPDIADRDLSALRRVTWGAAPASTDLLRRMIETFPDAEVTSVFGQTECSPVTTLLRGEAVQAAPSTRALLLHKLATAQLALGHWDHAVANAEQGARLADELGHHALHSELLLTSAWIAAARGDEQACSRCVDAAARHAGRRSA